MNPSASFPQISSASTPGSCGSSTSRRKGAAGFGRGVHSQQDAIKPTAGAVSIDPDQASMAPSSTSTSGFISCFGAPFPKDTTSTIPVAPVSVATRITSTRWRPVPTGGCMDILNRFPEEFQQKVFVCPISGCWVWEGTYHHRYPFFHHKKSLIPYLGKVERLAHRFACAYTNGPIPFEHDVHHVCLHTRCVNPQHAVALSHVDHIILHRWLRLLQIERTQTRLEITSGRELTNRRKAVILKCSGTMCISAPVAVTRSPTDQWEQLAMFT